MVAYRVELPAGCTEVTLVRSEDGSEAPALVDFMVRHLGYQVAPLVARSPIRLTVLDRRAVTLWVGASMLVSASKAQTSFALTLPGARVPGVGGGLVERVVAVRGVRAWSSPRLQ